MRNAIVDQILMERMNRRGGYDGRDYARGGYSRDGNYDGRRGRSPLAPDGGNIYDAAPFSEIM